MTLHIITVGEPALHFPDREILLIHRSVDYLLSVGVTKEAIHIVGTQSACIAWANNQGLHAMQGGVAETLDKLQACSPDKDLLIYNCLCPYREKNLVQLMQSQVDTEKDRLFVTASIREEAQLDWSMVGVKRGSKPLSELQEEENIYAVYHNPEASQIIKFRWQYADKVIDAWTNRVFSMDAWNAPCAKEHPRRLLINVDQGQH